ncbi:RecQ family ATP-dependent DNA helicase [Rhodococcus sp. IEGM 1408]|uniref:RecQ family ATP-dependent DNA helicase n=1 Tax=Rhodococcus sp. IEGM 1408 TaxID=3082220 RepID=UPI002953A82D|nr:RecQ family ATP-dependent DNA helicase [Rhodococcus sp. IEGM 1408]MDV8000682.1 RecQ family ATP-dependent DNA helicase [Rhodococcus sp. IEGM 1408]
MTTTTLTPPTESTDPREVARQVFGWDDLRPHQVEAIEAAVAGRDVLAVMPTGYGKSAIYQIAGIMAGGPCIVVSPLIALQSDQCEGLNELSGTAPTRSLAINSSMSARQQEQASQEVMDGRVNFVFLTPEQLAKQEVLDRIREAGPSFLTVDEAHCVAAWGHDFRPDYLRLDVARHRMGSPTVIALTATASTSVREEIVSRLEMPDALILSGGFDRTELHLTVRRHVEDGAKRDAVVERAVELPGPGLVYAATRRATEEYAQQIVEHASANGRAMRVSAYHAGQKTADREQTLAAFLDGELDVVVATSAFGMGIDREDVRFVLHADIPDSLDAYYQEAGRAGRDREPAEVELHYRSEDLGLRSFFSSHSADDEVVAAVVTRLRAADGPVRLTALRNEIDASGRRVTGAVNLLEACQVVTSGRTGVSLAEDLPPAQAVRRAQEMSETLERIDKSRIEMMRGYAETDGCRRQFLLGYFGEELADLCGNCDTCDAGIAVDITHEAAEFPLQSAVVHREWGSGIVMSVDKDRLTVFFEEQGYRTLSLELIRDQELLTPA